MTWRLIEQMRHAARRRLPRAVFDTIEGGGGDELALKRNREALDRAVIVPRVLDGIGRDTTVAVLGKPLHAPIIIAPTGMNGYYWPRGELAMTRAAAAAGVIHAVSAFASVSLEELAAAAPCRRWFQLYPLKDHGIVDDLVRRAEAAGFEALCITVDAPVVALRKRDVFNRVEFPPRLSPAFVAQALLRPSWAWPFVLGYRPPFANLAGYVISQARDARGLSLPELDANFSWSDLERIAKAWTGPIVVKGIMHPEDARRAHEAGAAAIVVSNHGGRQFDAAPASLDALFEIAGCAPSGLELYADGAVVSGADILKYQCAGARACLVGRSILYGLAADGERGAAAALRLLKSDLKIAQTLAGPRS